MPKIDGKLENPIWENATVLDTFTQYEPREGSEPSEPLSLKETRYTAMTK